MSANSDAPPLPKPGGLKGADKHAAAHHAHHAHHHAKPSFIQGIDVSNWDGRVDWAKVKKAGVTFAFAKATEGERAIDHTFKANWAGMQAAGLIRGAYHYARPRHDAATQANHFFNVVQPGPGDLPLVLDLENAGGLRHKKLAEWAKTFLDEIEDLMGEKGIFYSYGPFWEHEMGNPKDNFGSPLWLASYTHKPRVPHAWDNWTFWQYTSKGRVSGVHTHVDRNHFRGSLTELNDLTLS
jgi:lysozyme